MKTETIALGPSITLTLKKWLLVGLLVGGAAASGLGPWFHGRDRIQPRTETELGKILHLFQLYRQRDFKVIFNGTTYDMETAIQAARNFLVTHYQGEKAAAWIKARLYRSPDKREIIYLASPNGSRRPLRDVLIETLNQLPVK